MKGKIGADAEILAICICLLKSQDISPWVKIVNLYTLRVNSGKDFTGTSSEVHT